MGHRIATGSRLYPRHADELPGSVLRGGRYEVRFARSEEELDAILRMRFEVFNLELGEGLDTSFETGRDRDEFDSVCHHLLVRDTGDGEIVGSYRMQTSGMAAEHSGFYTATEFDLSTLPASVEASAVEVGRACVARRHRNTQVLFLLWKGLAAYVARNRLRYLFGCSSLTSQNPAEGLAVLDYLTERGHVHPEIRVRPRPECACVAEERTMSAEDAPDLPTLFRIYLRYGAKVCGPPAIDRRFKTIDFLVLLDVSSLSPRMFRTFFG